jgi:penicillin-binding protein 2
MKKRKIVIKNHLAEIKLIKQRCTAMLIIMLILVALLILRLGILQLTEHDLYTTLSKKNWLGLEPLEPTRGLIYDRNGVLLAENIPVLSLDIVPYKVNNLQQTLTNIAKIVPITDTDIFQFKRELKQHRGFDEIPLKYHLSEKDVARFAENQYHFPGVYIKAHLMRHYPLGAAFSHVLGYVARINSDDLKDIDATNYAASNYIGKLGIEKYYEDELHGTAGYEQAENDASGQPVRILNQINPVPGKNLYLTLDSQLQIAAENAMKGLRGAVIVIKPNTGEVLALVSEPEYDPNLFVEGISSRDFQQLQTSTDRPLYNRALRGLYPFASTIKPFLALEGLDSGVVSPDFTIFDPGWYQLPNSEHVFRDWRHHGHGTVNVSRAITVSCDTYFYDLAHKMGIKRINNMLHQFGFGELTGIDMGEELSGLLASPEWKRQIKQLPWYEGDTINAGIGQGFMQTTPLQLAVGIASIANRGQRFSPHLLLSEQEPGKPAEIQTPNQLKPIVLHDPEFWDVVINAMQKVFTSPEGTGGLHFGKNTSYTVAGKSGTAQLYTQTGHSAENDPQLYLPERLRDHSLFILYAPAEKPQIALAVIVENSKMAGSVARKILDYYFLGRQYVLRNDVYNNSGGNIHVSR